MIIRLGLFYLGALGFLISLYFTLVYHNKLRPDQWFIPRICRMDESTCRYIIRTPYSKVLGVQNSVLGLIYYVCVMAIALGSSVQATGLFYELVIAISIGTFLFSIYLTYSLLVKLRMNCILCFASHALNMLIMLLLIANASLDG